MSAPASASPRQALSLPLVALVLLVLAAAAFLRLYALDRLPGVNGDEAWYGVKAQQWLAGTLADWRTPTGNLPGPLQAGSMALLLSLFEPSFWLLRLPTVVSSLAAMALAFVTARRFFGLTSGVAALLMMAALPANIAYARFGWDPSHSGLVVLVATFLALARRPVWSALAFAVALWVHPTNVFVAPFLVLTFAGAEVERRTYAEARPRLILYVVLLVAALAVLTVTAQHVASGSALGAASAGAPGPAAVVEAKGWLLFPALYLQFLSGETVLEYITGSGWGAARPIANGIVAATLVGLLAVGGRRLWPKRFSSAGGVVAGWLASLGAFALIAGAPALKAGDDRYGLCLVVPTVMALAVLIGAVARTERQRGAALTIVAALALATLAGFWLRYVEPLAAGRGGTHRAFWTGPVEPKQAALAIIAADAGAGRARIIADDWWSYWPIAYLAGDRFTVVRFDEPGAAVSLDGPAYLVGWPGGALDPAVSGVRATRSWDVPALNPAERLKIWKVGAP